MESKQVEAYHLNIKQLAANIDSINKPTKKAVPKKTLSRDTVSNINSLVQNSNNLIPSHDQVGNVVSGSGGVEEDLKPELKECDKILKELLSYPCNEYSWPFIYFSEPEMYGMYDLGVEKPMDFNIITQNLKNRQYENALEFAADVRLIFENCEKYFTSKKNFVEMGRKVKDIFENRFEKIELRDPEFDAAFEMILQTAVDAFQRIENDNQMQEKSNGKRQRSVSSEMTDYPSDEFKKRTKLNEDIEEPMTYDEKRKLWLEIHKLGSSVEEVNYIVKIIQNREPHLCDTRLDGIEVDLEALKASTLREIKDFVTSVNL